MQPRVAASRLLHRLPGAWGACAPPRARRPLARAVNTLRSSLALNPSLRLGVDRKTKIVCTIGPACINILPDMLYAGMNVARINCAHGDAVQYTHIVNKLREAEATVRAAKAAATCPTSIDGPALSGGLCELAAVAFDIKGPEIRTGRFGPSVPHMQIQQYNRDGTVRIEQGPKEVPLRKGDIFTLVTDRQFADQGSESEMFITYEQLIDQVRPGQPIWIDDGNVLLRVISVDVAAGRIKCESQTNHPIGERKNVNLPGIVIDLPAVTEKDKVDIATAREVGADFIFASFVQNADAVRQIRELAGPNLRIISKIENQAGIDNIKEIISASDGIMVARGDLGVQIPGERVFLAQKHLVALANVQGKVVICATQMLDSMVHSLRPTRAEIVDVCSAVMDGADAVMLSGETAKGKYPVEAVMTMSRCAQAAEAAYDHRGFFNALTELPETPVGVEDDESLKYHEEISKRQSKSVEEFMTIADVETIAASAVHASFESKAAAIVVLSRMSGRTAMLVAKQRPACPVICVTTEPVIARKLQLRRGIQAILVPRGTSNERCKQIALEELKRHKAAKVGDKVVMLHGTGEEVGNFGAGMMVYMSKVK